MAASWMDRLGDELADDPAGTRARWALRRLAEVAAGGPPPDRDEISAAYAPTWLAEVPIGRGWFLDLAPVVGAVVAGRVEASRPGEVTVVLELADGSWARGRWAVEPAAPHRIGFQLVGPAVDPATVRERVVRRDGRVVHARDHGGAGPLLLLLHGSGCDATVWEGMVPSLRAFRVVAVDLPGHGASPLPRLDVGQAICDAVALVDELDLGDPVVVGHSLGGWVALHLAATSGRVRGLVCLDGPASLAYGAMGLSDEHPGFLADPPDVVADLAALRTPTAIVLCSGSSAEAAWMVPFRQGLGDHVDRLGGPARVEWLAAPHMAPLTHPREAADLVVRFVRERLG